VILPRVFLTTGHFLPAGEMMCFFTANGLLSLNSAVSVSPASQLKRRAIVMCSRFFRDSTITL